MAVAQTNTSVRPVLSNITNITCKDKCFSIEKPQIFPCHVCKKVYSNRYGLYKHKVNNHSDYHERKGNIKCQENQCTYTCRVLSNYRMHLQTEHKIPMEIEEKTFYSFQGMLNIKILHTTQGCTLGTCILWRRVITMYMYFIPIPPPPPPPPKKKKKKKKSISRLFSVY